MKTFEHFFVEKSAYKIYCDLDGVLCDWDKKFAMFGMGTEKDVEKEHYPLLPWIMISNVGSSWWATIPWKEDGKKLWKFLKGHNPTILTGVPKYGKELAKEGKLVWINSNLGDEIPVVFSYSFQKWEEADDKSILIDDRENNINDWIDKGKGIGILHKSAEETIEKLKGLVGIN